MQPQARQSRPRNITICLPATEKQLLRLTLWIKRQITSSCPVTSACPCAPGRSVNGLWLLLIPSQKSHTSARPPKSMLMKMGFDLKGVEHKLNIADVSSRGPLLKGEIIKPLVTEPTVQWCCIFRVTADYADTICGGLRPFRKGRTRESCGAHGKRMHAPRRPLFSAFSCETMSAHFKLISTQALHPLRFTQRDFKARALYGPSNSVLI